MKGGDLVSIIEAAYAVDLPEHEWLAGLVAAARPLSAGLGVCGYLYDLNVRPIRSWSYVNDDTPHDAAVCAAVLGSVSEDYIERTWKTLPCGLGSEGPGFDENPVAKEYFQPRGIADVFAINACDPSGVGVWVGTPLPKRKTLQPRERNLWSRVSAHMGAAFRLRRRLEAPAAPEAVLTPSGRIAHASGEAELGAARVALREAVVAMERARGSMRRKDPGAAVTTWRALVLAKWSLVEELEAGGSRYVVARTNDPIARGPDLLAPREKQVLGFAILGHENKLIAYELGISASTVRVLLSRAARKLGARSRTELIERYRAHSRG